MSAVFMNSCLLQLYLSCQFTSDRVNLASGDAQIQCDDPRRYSVDYCFGENTIDDCLVFLLFVIVHCFIKIVLLHAYFFCYVLPTFAEKLHNDLCRDLGRRQNRPVEVVKQLLQFYVARFHLNEPVVTPTVHLLLKILKILWIQ